MANHTIPTKFVLFSAVMGSIVSCSGKEPPQRGNASQTSGTVPPSRVNTGKPTPVSSNNFIPDDDANIDTDGSDTAVMVNGASLICSYSQSLPLEARCATLNKELERIDFSVTNAYIVKKFGATPLVTNLKRVGMGLYAVVIPANISGSFAISLVNNAQKLGDWIIDPIDSASNKVLDGSFELVPPPLTPTSVFNVDPASSTNWTIKNAPGSDCANPVLEVHRASFDGQRPSQGQVWVELDSKCLPDESIINHIAITQELKLVAGNSYEVKFDYRKREGEEGNPLHFRVGDEEEVVLASAATSWGTYNRKFTASSAATVIQFFASGPEKLGIGPQLDNVRVFDLGPSSAK